MSRRIDEDRLIGAAVQHTEHALARGVRLVRDDTELFADEGVQQRGFADIGAADDRDETAAAGRGANCLAHRSVPPAWPRRLLARRGGGFVPDPWCKHVFP